MTGEPDALYDIILVEEEPMSDKWKAWQVESGYRPPDFDYRRKIILRDLTDNAAAFVGGMINTGLITLGYRDIPPPDGPRLIVDNEEK